MNNQIGMLIEEVRRLSCDPSFVHHKWFFQWHLEIVVSLTEDMLKLYPAADRNTAIVMAWMHDYGKIVDFNNQFDELYIDEGADLLRSIGFDSAFADSVAQNLKVLESKIDIDKANIETQIVSSADGCSHLVGPFISLFWWENPDMKYEDILANNVYHLTNGWQKKVVIPEAVDTYQLLHDAAIDRAKGIILNITPSS